MPAVSQSFRCFDEVARRGSIRKAAETLHLTAAAVHQQILNLEAQVGTLLFDRLPRGMQLTSAGEIMIAAVRRGQRDYDNALTQVEDLRALRRGHVNLAVSQSSTEHLVPDVIHRAMTSHPGITYSVRSGSGESILRWVANGEADIGFCLRRKTPPGVEEVRAFPQQLGLVTAPGHPRSAPGKALRLRDCLDLPLILMTPDTELRAMVDQIDHREHRKARPLVETSSVAMVRSLVARGVGISFLIQENVAEAVARGDLVWTRLTDPGAESFSGLYQRPGQSTAVAMGMFLGFLEAALTAMHASFDTARAGSDAQEDAPASARAIASREGVTTAFGPVMAAFGIATSCGSGFTLVSASEVMSLRPHRSRPHAHLIDPARAPRRRDRAHDTGRVCAGIAPTPRRPGDLARARGVGRSARIARAALDARPLGAQQPGVRAPGARRHPLPHARASAPLNDRVGRVPSLEDLPA